MLQSLDSTYIEHDAYILFDKLMTYGKAWYEFNEGLPSSSRIKVTRYIFEDVLFTFIDI